MHDRIRVMRVSTVGMLVIMLLFLAACGQEELPASATPVPSGTAVATATPTPEPTPPPITAPLTGVGRETEALNQPIAVMINNFSAARPQSGLTHADVIWEVLAEGGITRLVAIFQSTDSLTDTIGPIRSNRAYLIDIADSYRAVMVHAGGSPEAYGILQKQGKQYLDEISNAGPYFWRSKERKAPHNLYSNLEKVRQGIEKKGYKSEQPVVVYPFTEEGAMIGSTGAAAESVASLDITFLTKSYKVGYIYEESTGLYKRSINDEPHVDKENDEQLSAINLIVFETGHKTLDDVGRIAVDLVSGGEGYLFQKGKKIDIEWVRSADGMVRFLKDGAEVPLLPGKTYIHVVPNKPQLADHVTVNPA